MEHDLCGVGRSTVAFVTHAHLRSLIAASPKLANAFWRETLIQAASLRSGSKTSELARHWLAWPTSFANWRRGFRWSAWWRMVASSCH